MGIACADGTPIELNLSPQAPIIRVTTHITRQFDRHPFRHEEGHMPAASADHRIAWTLSVGGHRINCVLRRTERPLQVLIHTNVQPLYMRTINNTIDADAGAEQERAAWATL